MLKSITRPSTGTGNHNWWRNHNSDVINATAWYVLLVVLYTVAK